MAELAKNRTANGMAFSAFGQTAEPYRSRRRDDTMLIRQAQEGNTDAFEQLVRHYDQTVLRLAMHLTGSQDDAQEIFASLNGLGKPLTAMDLIRNDVFYRARRGGEDDEAIFEGHWKTFEHHVSSLGRVRDNEIRFT